MILRNYSFRNAPYTAVQRLANESTAEFVINTCPSAIACRSPKALMTLALSRVSLDGEFLEFGVWKGASINFMAKKFPDKNIHGFDSFEGLPESWVHNDIGTFTLKGKLPKVSKNVTLHKGWFEDTLPGWAEKNNNKIALLHVDCDLYSATKTIFDLIGEYIVPGTVIIFDDYFNFPNWQEDGHKVFSNFIAQTNHEVHYLGYAFKELAVIIK